MLCVVRNALGELAAKLGFPEPDCRAVVLAVDEALTNIIRHAYLGDAERPIEASFRRIQVARDGKSGEALEILLEDERAHQPAARALAWFDVDPVAGKLYIDYLGAASLGVAAVLDAMPTSAPHRAAWLTHAAKDLHAQPDFNRVWIEECAFARGGACA